MRRKPRQRTRRADGTLSGLEGKVLAQLRKKRVKFGYEVSKIPYIMERTYNPDFTLLLPSGKTIYVEVKGYLRPEDRSKMRAVVKSNPDLDIRFLFGRNNPLYKGSPSTYVDWATRLGCKCAVGEIPTSWLKE